MDTYLKEVLRRRSARTFGLTLPLIPYLYFLYQAAVFFVTFHGWPVYSFLFPVGWILLTFLWRLRKGPTEGYFRVDESDDIELNTRYYGVESAYGRLKRLISNITLDTDMQPKINFYVYPKSGKDANKRVNVFTFLANGQGNILISQNSLEEQTDGQLCGVIAHELGHLYSPGAKISRLAAILGIMCNCFELFICVAIGFINWWFFLPALVAIGLVHMTVCGLPQKHEEDSADLVAVKLGFGYSLISWLEEVGGLVNVYDGVHRLPASRIKRIRKMMVE